MSVQSVLCGSEEYSWL